MRPAPKRPTLAALSALAASALALAGCGGSSKSNGASNGIESKSPEAIVSAASSALQSVSSVHVSGSMVSEGSPIKLDLTLASGKGGRGQLTENGLSFRIIAIAQTVYINGSDAFWRHFGGAAAEQLFHGKWLKSPASGQLGSIAELTNLHTLFTKLLAGHGKLAKGSSTTVAGKKVVAIRDTTQGGTLYVAATGKPYPVEINKTGSEAGAITFDDYNQPVSLTAPKGAVDITQLEHS